MTMSDPESDLAAEAFDLLQNGADDDAIEYWLWVQGHDWEAINRALEIAKVWMGAEPYAAKADAS
jgi:hypothetical protein